MARVGLFIGRFQPLHRGHLLMMKKLAPTVERFVVGIGSANVEPSCKNPFTAAERMEMVRRGMKELAPTLRPKGSEVGVPTPKGVGRATEYEIVELPDLESDAEWIREVVERTQFVISTPTVTSGEKSHIVQMASARHAEGKRSLHSLRSVEMTKQLPFDIAWSGSDWVIRVFEAHNLPIERIKEFPGLSGTKIRRRMAQGLPWLKFVPLSVRKYLREIGAVKRVRALCQPQ